MKPRKIKRKRTNETESLGIEIKEMEGLGIEAIEDKLLNELNIKKKNVNKTGNVNKTRGNKNTKKYLIQLIQLENQFF